VNSFAKRLKIFILKKILEIHSFSYKLAGSLSQKVEKTGLHPKHRIMNYHQFFVDNIKEGDTILDIGCGNGALTFDLAKKAKKVVGIDISKNNIKIARNKYDSANIEYKVGDATKDLDNKKFDAVVLSNVLEHIKDRQDFLNKIKDLAPKILIRVPMINRDWITLYKKELGLEWRLDKTHYIEYTLDTFKEEIEKVGLSLDSYSIQFGEIWAVVK